MKSCVKCDTIVKKARDHMKPRAVLHQPVPLENHLHARVPVNIFTHHFCFGVRSLRERDAHTLKGRKQIEGLGRDKERGARRASARVIVDCSCHTSLMAVPNDVYLCVVVRR